MRTFLKSSQVGDHLNSLWDLVLFNINTSSFKWNDKWIGLTYPYKKVNTYPTQGLIKSILLQCQKREWTRDTMHGDLIIETVYLWGQVNIYKLIISTILEVIGISVGKGVLFQKPNKHGYLMCKCLLRLIGYWYTCKS